MQTRRLTELSPTGFNATERVCPLVFEGSMEEAKRTSDLYTQEVHRETSTLPHVPKLWLQVAGNIAAEEFYDAYETIIPEVSLPCSLSLSFSVHIN